MSWTPKAETSAESLSIETKSLPSGGRMVRLTIELIRASPQFQNPCKQRELDVRGNKIPAVENMGATDNQFEVIDLSDNELTKLQNFGRLDRLVGKLRPHKLRTDAVG